MSNPQVAIAQEFLNGYRDNFDESLQKAIQLSGINIKKEVSTQEMHHMQMYMDGDITWKKLQDLISRIGEKTLCNILCGGDLAEFNDWKRDLKSIEEDMEKARTQEGARYVTVDEGKMMQDHATGDHAPTHATHLNNGLGANAGFVSRYNMALCIPPQVW